MVKKLSILFFFLPLAADNLDQNFIQSFINNYGFSSNARDTREYHPFILNNTRESFSQLEAHIKDQGFLLDGRMIICGYQEDAVPSYYTSCNQGVIDDEVSIKSNVGWQFAAGNLFGFITGFLLKDVNCLHEKIKEPVFEHMVPDRVGLFDGNAQLFHQHAFGSAYDFMRPVSYQIARKFARNDSKGVLKILHAVWQQLYERGIHDGTGTMIATQDILFSINYANYLLDSVLPIKKFFIGPDITYPIEVLPCQKKEATEGAQTFVKRLHECLQPVNGEKTAYIFCSFVDGVGKSTLLGNIKNWLRFGDEFENYERVDNSSSQHPTLFGVNEDVAIVDLPAQVSHSVPKPDGFVYVDVRTIKEFTGTDVASLQEYVFENQERLEEEFAQRDEIDGPAGAYIKNLHALGITNPQWIPFSHNNHHCLFNSNHPDDIRRLVSFDVVHSYGLKVVEPEQMIFSKGVRMPIEYDSFLQELSDKLHEAKIKRVVLVDFISMYPRTSRENIRVNFLLQQLKFVFGDAFDLGKSLYKGFVNPQEIYLLLKNHRQIVEQSLTQETVMRWGLYQLLQEGQTHIPFDQITPLLRGKTAELLMEHQDYLEKVAHEKVEQEYHHAIQSCSFDKIFETLVRFDAVPLLKFSELMQHLFANLVRNEYFNAAWSLPTQETLYTFNRQCRERIVLKEIISTVRAHWYAALSNILDWTYDQDGWQASEVKTFVPPLLLTESGEQIAVVRPLSLPPEDGLEENIPDQFFVGVDEEKERRFGMIAQNLHCLDWSDIKTSYDLYSYAHLPRADKKNMITRLVEQYKTTYEAEGRSNMFISTQFLYNCLCRLNMWDQLILQTASVVARPAGQKRTCDRESARLFVRCIATLDMILKDLDADILVRKGSQEDFTAAILLLERVTLPIYFGITFKQPLFENYTQIEPVIEWNYLEKYKENHENR